MKRTVLFLLVLVVCAGPACQKKVAPPPDPSAPRPLPGGKNPHGSRFDSEAPKPRR